MRRRVLSGVLAAFVLFALASLPVGGNKLYFSAVNYAVNPFDVYHQPLAQESGSIMMPHFALTGERLERPNGLGLRSHWSPEESYFTLTDDRSSLTFVVDQNRAFNRRGEPIIPAPCFRTTVGGVQLFYVPLELVCGVFGYTYGVRDSDWGTMVRVRQRGYFDDENFIRTRGQSFIRPEYEAYLAAQQSPTAPPTSPPTPSALFDVSVYLTFDGAVSDATAGILDFLETHGLPALFFLPPEGLDENPDVIRRIAAQHQIGLLIQGKDADSMDEAIRHGNELLRRTAFIKTWLLRSDRTPSETGGYRYWGYSRRYSETDSFRDIVRSMTPLLRKTSVPSVQVFSLPHTEAATDALAEMLELTGTGNIWRVNPGETPIK
jgi:peptidoglycan/xylan/chitin deacetylase (PgdA/CDA1 family)